MRREESVVRARRHAILNLIRQNDEQRVEDIAEKFEVSTMTVRRDLQYLEDRRLVTRFHGGATASLNIHYKNEEEQRLLCRRRIAQYASRFVSAGDRVFINGSCTALDLLDFVEQPRVSVVTNNGNAIGRSYFRGVTVTLTGGELRDSVLVGNYVMRNLLGMSATKTFIGCAGINQKGELSYDIPTEIGINETMISRTTGELYILADHTKLQPTSPEQHYGSCIYEHPWTLITDEFADPTVIEGIKAQGKRVHIVPLEDTLE